MQIDNGSTDIGGEIVDGEWAEQWEDVHPSECDLVLRVPVPPQLPVREDRS